MAVLFIKVQHLDISVEHRKYKQMIQHNRRYIKQLVKLRDFVMFVELFAR